MAVRDSAWQIAASPLPVLAASSGRCELAVGVYAPGPVLATLSPSAFRRASSSSDPDPLQRKDSPPQILGEDEPLTLELISDFNVTVGQLFAE